MRELSIHSPSEACTTDIGCLIGRELLSGDVLALWGELGVGKTFLTRAIARGLGIPPEVPVTSPTFTFINEYEGRLHLYHLDLYRLGDPDELETLPWREALFGTGAAVVEWPDRLGRFLPDDRWDIRLSVTGDESRSISIIANGGANQTRLARWAAALQPVIGSPVCNSED